MFAPEAVSVAELPPQMVVWLAVMVKAAGLVVTTSSGAEVVVPQLLTAVAVYAVVLVGLAVTKAPVVLLKPEAGLQE